MRLKSNTRFLRIGFSLGLVALPILFILAAVMWPNPSLVIQAAEPQLSTSQTRSIAFTASSYTVAENDSDSLVSISVQISAVPTSNVTVTYRTADGTATAGSDYTSVSGSLVFTSTGPSIQTFNVSIVNDTTPEDSETINLILQEPANATLGSPNVAQLIITNDDASPTPTGNAATPIYVDIYEANNNIQTAYTIEVNNTAFCTSDNATLWPSGDIDFYKFWAQAGSAYTVKTDNVDIGLDTYLVLYDSNGNQLAENDTASSTSLNSSITFSASTTGYHYMKVTNEDASDPADKTYCAQVNEIAGTSTPTPLPTGTSLPTTTPVPGADTCEDNASFSDACIIAPNEQISLNFVPPSSDATDNDYFRMWVKEGWYYTCETTDLSGYNDTNMIMYDANQNGLAGNNDKTYDDLGSLIGYQATYTGWIYLLVGPVVEVAYKDSYRYTYNLVCASDTSTATPVPTNTIVYTSGTGTGVVSTSTPTPTPAADVDALATLITQLTRDAEIEGTQATATPPANVSINILPTSTPYIPPAILADLSVVLFYDENNDNLPQVVEGIQDMPVFIYDGSTGQLLTLGYTNQAGTLRFSVSPTSEVLRISVPFLGISQIMSTSVNEILIRVAPNSLPSTTP